MGRKRASLIIIALAVLVGLAVIGSRPDKPVVARNSEISQGPSFEVHVDKPLLARPIFEIPGRLLGVSTGSDLGFDHTSGGAKVVRVGHDRLELIAEGWDLLIEVDDEGRVGPETRLVFTLELGGNEPTLRCRPAVPAVGHLDSAAQAGFDELGGSFRVELATCEIAETGKVIQWPPAPLVVFGSFDRLLRSEK